jgi:hypothetical protein
MRVVVTGAAGCFGQVLIPRLCQCDWIERVTGVDRKPSAPLRQARVRFNTWRIVRGDHFASKLVQAGVDLYTVKELLGDSAIAMTERYSHLPPDKTSESARCWAHGLSKGNTKGERSGVEITTTSGAVLKLREPSLPVNQL